VSTITAREIEDTMEWTAEWDRRHCI